MYLDSIVPFYVAYPNYRMFSDEYRRMQDLEYLQAMYPMKVKEYQRKINQVLVRIDYAGSMIYDEYPDRWQLYRLAENIVTILKNEAQDNGEEHTQEKWEWISDMVQVLLFDEIFNRRHGNNQGRRRNRIFLDGDNWKSPYV